MINTNKKVIELDYENIELLSHKRFNAFAVVNAFENAELHHHIFFELLYIISGTVHHSINGETTEEMHKGDFIFIDIGTIHEYQSNGAKALNVIFTPRLIDKNISTCMSVTELFKRTSLNLETLLTSFPSDTVLHDTDGALLNLIMFLKAKFNNPLPLSYSIIRDCVISMLMHITEPQFISHKSLNRITKALLKIIDEHYSEPNLLSRAANELKYTIPYISATFKNDFGISFKEYLQIHRINKAKHLLDTTNMSILDISFAVGYSNIKFFRTTFKKYTNITPTQYKTSSLINHPKK